MPALHPTPDANESIRPLAASYIHESRWMAVPELYWFTKQSASQRRRPYLTEPLDRTHTTNTLDTTNPPNTRHLRVPIWAGLVGRCTSDLQDW